MITSALTLALALVAATPSTTLAVPQAPAPQPPAPQAPAPSAPVVAPAVAAPMANFPILTPAVESADCGRLLGSPAYCVSADLTEVGALAERYLTSLEGMGWLAADGDDNRVIFVRRKPDGTCDGMQMIAFYDESKPVTPTTVGYLGFAAIPGNICVAPPAQGPSSQ